MCKLIVACLAVIMGCAEQDPEVGVQVQASGINTTFADGVPDPGSTWVQDPATGWGLLQGAVNFEVHNLLGDTTAYSMIRDNANSCMYCADGDSVVMMYAVYIDSNIGMMVSSDSSLSDGTPQLLRVQELPHGPGRVVIRFYTSFVFPPSPPRLSLIQPPHS